MVSTTIQNIMIEHTSNICSIANEIKYDVDDTDQKHQLYKQFFAWCCKVCSIVPLTYYAKALYRKTKDMIK